MPNVFLNSVSTVHSGSRDDDDDDAEFSDIQELFGIVGSPTLIIMHPDGK